MAIRRKKNIAGFYDELGRFRPIRSPQFVGTPKRKATPKDRKKYSRAKAGDNGIAAQERATGEDFFSRLGRKEREAKEKTWKRIERETLGDADESDRGRSLVEFVRDKGGIKPGYKFGGKANRGKRISYDAGELAPLTYKESGKRGLVSDKGKLSLDRMFQSAREAGYAVADTWDLLSAMQDEINGGKITYSNRGYMDYRDNPKAKRNGVLVGDRENNSDLYVTQLGPKSYGVFLKTYLLKKFTTKLGAMKHIQSIRTKAKKNPIDPIGTFANITVGLASAMQINDMLKKKPAKRKGRVTAKTNGRTTAKRKTTRKNPHGDMPSGARFNEKLFDQDLAAIEDGNFRMIRSANAHGKLAGYGKSEIERLVQRARLAFQLKEMYRRKDNPADIATLLAPLKTNGAFKRMLQRRKAAAALKRELKLERALEKTRAKKRKAIASATANPKSHPATLNRSSMLVSQLARHEQDSLLKRWIPAFNRQTRGRKLTTLAATRRNKDIMRYFLDEPVVIIEQYIDRTKKNPSRSAVGKKAVTRSANPKTFYVVGGTGRVVASFKTRKQANEYAKLHPAYRVTTSKPNPATAKRPPRSRTFETFQGRPVTNATRRPVSRHAPAKLVQLGDLIEVKLVGMTPIKLNPSRTKLTTANGRLWIVGQKFAKPSAGAKANEINPIGEIDHVVYGTRKPHHGDHAYTHYIHKLGEDSGKRPLLCVDKEGFAVIRGGNYKIEARGIVD